MRASLSLALCLALGTPLGSWSQTKVAIQTGSAMVPEAQRAGIPTKVGSWVLVRHVPGVHGHFLYAADKRTFSLFLTETGNTRPLQPQKGWKTIVLGKGQSAFEHQDSRNPERTALVFKHQTQRRLIMGKLTEAELVSLAQQLR
ncbi:hypothetical protein [Armatimonas rosea]|uniref:DUF4367 domain-containing protein n=1 Tax=Armatimonas rosea TaxID=685828 RepID=A0A7W9SU40_ARMRO|nr:hypothetical protein [Armatimonas rosea]MBB6052872.1 hypothetical protein [Armatimonas rosea]